MGGAKSIEPRVRHRARYFRRENLLAEPQTLEKLDFSGGVDLRQSRKLEFWTDREAMFDGIHMHLYVDLDGEASIDALQLHSSRDRSSICSWNTTYVRMLDEPLLLKAGSRICCECEVDLSGLVAQYSVSVFVGEGSEERHVSRAEWSGG